MYIPKNRLITNLYTRGNELVYKDDKALYTGYYYKTYDGKYFTGKTPNEKPNDELELTTLNAKTFEALENKSQIAFIDTPVVPSDNKAELVNSILIIDYSKLKGIDLNNPTGLIVPSQYYPQPIQSNYDLGSFVRYFIVKINESKFLEINQNTYDAIKTQNKEWSWEAYTPFLIQWTLVGGKQQVYNTNKNIVLLAEQRLGKKGLGRFLKEDYNQFYK
jgi:hypothetical protein